MLSSGEKFTRLHRLLCAADFSAVFDEPIKSSDRYFTVLAIKKTNQAARLGLAISKKNTRLAVDRNRLKRIIRESFRKNQNQLTGLDMVVMARHQTSKQDNKRLFDSLQQHWNRLKEKTVN